MSTKRLVVCPYNEAHKVKESRYQLHISKCRENQGDKEEKFICPFNATHVMTKPERTYHIQHCPDRATVDRKLSQSLNKNNPHKGRTAVPSYNEAPLVVAEEDWDLDDDNDGFKPLDREVQPPQGAIIEPPPKSKPADRRKLYQDLHRAGEIEPEQPQASSQVTIPKAPNQPHTVSKIEALRKRDDLLNLGLGQNRSIPTQRIAANIYPGPVNGFSNALKNLSISGDIPRENGFRPNENEFPVLGVGRGRAARH